MELHDIIIDGSHITAGFEHTKSCDVYIWERRDRTRKAVIVTPPVDGWYEVKRYHKNIHDEYVPTHRESRSRCWNDAQRTARDFVN